MSLGAPPAKGVPVGYDAALDVLAVDEEPDEELLDDDDELKELELLVVDEPESLLLLELSVELVVEELPDEELDLLPELDLPEPDSVRESLR